MTEASENTEQRRRDVQGLRAVAVLMVVAYHAELPVRGGFVGVDVFFVISGFVITGMLLREIDATGRFDARGFFLRRYRRIVPALVTMIGIVAIVASVATSPRREQGLLVTTGLSAVAGLSNAVAAVVTGDYFNSSAESNLLLHTWSLGVEEQFYAFLALLLGAIVVVRRFGVSVRARLAGVVVAVSVLSFALSRLPVSVNGSLVGYFSPLVRTWEFAVGVLLALSWRRISALPESTRRGIGWIGAAGLIVAVVTVAESAEFPDSSAILPVFATAAVIVGGSTGSLVDRWLSGRSLVRLGDISYSVYLWHWPMIALASLNFPGSGKARTIAAVLSVPVGSLSHAHIEERFRNRPDGARSGRTRHVSALVGATIAALAVVGAGARNGWGATWQGRGEASDSIAWECDAVDPEMRCMFPEPGSADILLVGDSMAMSYSDGVVAAGGQLGRRVSVVSRRMCPYAPGFSSPAIGPQCGSFSADVARIIERDGYSTVVVANRTLRYAVDPESADAYRNALASEAARLSARGITVVLVRNGPEPDHVGPVPSFVNRLLGRTNDVRSPRAVALEGRVVSDDVESGILAASDDMRSVDAAEVLCDAEECAVIVQGIGLYYDKRHLSVDGSRRIAPLFVEALHEQ